MDKFLNLLLFFANFSGNCLAAFQPGCYTKTPVN